ncbi:MAG: tetratricopeptide repeat protein [Leptospiraceae bacterium]|nr:tetratricopeptide repeat protein [Leptospiraceae bacterium]MCP5503411.1 tetratricopeptide repeat protein [Leptospiraceae bacterium]
MKQTIFIFLISITFLYPESSIQNSIKKAQDLLQKENYTEANKAFSILCSEHPGAACFNSLGITFLALKDYPSAIKFFKKAIVIEPEHPYYHSNLAQAYFQKGDRVLAEQYYKKSYELDKEAVSILSSYGVFLLYQNEILPAKELFQKAIQLDDSYFYPKLYMGLIYMKENKLQEAMLEFNRAIELQANYYDLYYYRALCFYKLREYLKRISGNMYTYKLFIILFLLSFQLLLAESDLFFQHNEYGTLSFDPLEEYETEEEKVNSVNLLPILSSYKSPAKRYCFLTNSSNQVITHSKTLILVPSYSFKTESGFIVEGEVCLEVTEIIQDIDFISSGLSLHYRDKEGRKTLFESGGMFQIRAFHKNKEVFLVKTLSLKFPAVSNAEGMGLYKINQSEQWERVNTAVQKSGDLSYSDETKRVGVYITSIDNSAFYNFDKPSPEIACLKGKIQFSSIRKGEYVNVLAMGVDHKFIAYTSIDKDNDYEINVIQGKRYKIIYIDSEGNIGVSKELESPKKRGFARKKESGRNFKLQVPEITIEYLGNEKLKNKDVFKSYIGIYDEYYNVKFSK